ncbi:MAG TPA: cyclic nucleotide-binding domain-containing protein [Candidatus Marinimicrobia bacterium]|nr:cyclic nucleotide-binding domain-containing protein [Candidatus Neomarinimicrobiota bacterium]HRS51480.1 cyclic nucleotide-binding domain-containing protein [Candidatus Neomarinimicrobiota bacterium]HRU92750.1 cyclic nucleotide-binding domain-containing protein [Candidatus Neomarinimicrobiota bacterium]
MRELNFKPGDVIIDEGTFGSVAYILKAGSVEVSKMSEHKKVVLAILQPQEIFGELGLIDDKPRSASVIAKTNVTVDEITREDFTALLDDKVPFVIPILRAFFEHLRQANQLVLQMESQIAEASKTATQATAPSEIKLEGLTPIAKQALKNRVVCLRKFPYKIGRESGHRREDVFVDNDLSLVDNIPYNVSRNHMSVNFYNGQYYILDRGSSLGTIVNNVPIGGHLPNFKAELHRGENIVILGTSNSQFQFKITI